MEVIYKADDGEEFEGYWGCREYEFLLNHPHLKTITFYGKHGVQIFIHEKEYYIMWNDKQFYEDVEYIIIHNENELADFMDFVLRAGYISFQTIDSVGEWKMNYETYNMEKVEK